MAGKKKVAKEKQLEKMTAKELREVAKATTSITGVHGMNKEELVSAVKKERGITESAPRKSDTSVREVKQKIRALKTRRATVLADSPDRKTKDVIRRKLSKLKKKTRRA
jgi:hypothetical protein